MSFHGMAHQIHYIFAFIIRNIDMHYLFCYSHRMQVFLLSTVYCINWNPQIKTLTIK